MFRVFFSSLREIQKVSQHGLCLSEASPLSGSQEPPSLTSPPSAEAGGGVIPRTSGSLAMRTGFGLISSCEKSTCL